MGKNGWLMNELAGLFYGGYGAVMIPWFGVVQAYGGYTPEFYNAFGFFILSKTIQNSPACPEKLTLRSMGRFELVLSSCFNSHVSVSASIQMRDLFNI